MPVYEYRCTSCEHQFDIWQEVGSAPPPCEKCGSEVKKIFHPVRTIFKGSGFYVTDTRAESSKASGGALSTSSENKSDGKSDEKSESKSDGGDKASTPASESKSETKSESKSESKPDAKATP